MAQQLADFQAHVYKILGQTRTQHQSNLDRLMEELADKRRQVSNMAGAASLANTAAQAAADAAARCTATLEAHAEHRNAELARMWQAAEAQREELAALSVS